MFFPLKQGLARIKVFFHVPVTVYKMTSTPILTLKQLPWEVVWGTRPNSKKRQQPREPLPILKELLMYIFYIYIYFIFLYIYFSIFINAPELPKQSYWMSLINSVSIFWRLGFETPVSPVYEVVWYLYRLRQIKLFNIHWITVTPPVTCSCLTCVER